MASKGQKFLRHTDKEKKEIMQNMVNYNTSPRNR